MGDSKTSPPGRPGGDLMSIKLQHFIELFRVESGTDSEGFPTERDEMLASIRAYREDRYGSEAWKNRSLFSKATTLFRIRVIPGIKLDTRCVVVTEDGRYNILSVEDIRHKGLYWEILAEKVDTEGVVQDGTV